MSFLLLKYKSQKALSPIIFILKYGNHTKRDKIIHKEKKISIFISNLEYFLNCCVDFYIKVIQLYLNYEENIPIIYSF